MGASGPGLQHFPLGYFRMPSWCSAWKSLSRVPASSHPPEGEFWLIARALSCCLGLMLAYFDCEMRFPSMAVLRPEKHMFRPVSFCPSCLHRLWLEYCPALVLELCLGKGEIAMEWKLCGLKLWSEVLLEVHFSWLEGIFD